MITEVIVYPLTRLEELCIRVVAVMSAGVLLAVVVCSVLLGG